MWFKYFLHYAAFEKPQAVLSKETSEERNGCKGGGGEGIELSSRGNSSSGGSLI